MSFFKNVIKGSCNNELFTRKWVSLSLGGRSALNIHALSAKREAGRDWSPPCCRALANRRSLPQS